MGSRAIAARFGVDRTVAWSLATRVVQGIATVGMLALVLLRLSAAEQGYYLTQASFSALQLFTEFGMAYALMQTASHHAHDAAPEALQALLGAAQRRNTVTTLGGAVLVGLLGYLVLGTRPATDAVTWRLPWLALVVAVAANHQLYPGIAVLEGTGRTVDAWRWRAKQEAAGGLAVLLSLLIGARLWSPAIGYGARLAAAVLQSETWAIASTHAVQVAREEWRELTSFQRKMGVSTVSGFLLFQLLGPLLFLVAGPVIAGQVGLAMVLCNGVIGVTTAWLQSRAPSFGRHVAARDLAALDHAFSHVLSRSLAFSALVSSGVAVTALLLAHVVPRLAERLPTAEVLVPVMAAAVVHHYIVALATYLRAGREEPLMVLYVVGSIVMAAVLAVVAMRGTPAEVAATYLSLSVLGAGVASAIFVRRRRHWRHAG